MRRFHNLTAVLCAVLAAVTCQTTFAFYKAELIDAPAPIIFEVSIFKKPRSLLLDLAMTQPFALNRSSFPQLQGEPLLVNGKDMGAAVTKLEPHVKIGQMTLYNPKASLMNLNELSRNLGADIEGAVGVVAFERKVFDFNYSKRIVTVSDSADSINLQGAKSIKLLQDMLVPAVHVIINGKPVPFLIDTGFNGNFRVDSETLAELKNSGCLSVRRATQTLLEADGKFHGTSVFNLTKHMEPFQDVDLAYVDVASQEGDNVRNVIGLDLLRNYNFVIDLRGGLMHLIPRRDKIARMPTLEDALGIRFEFIQDECRIASIKKESEFIKKYELKVGNLLLSMGAAKDGEKQPVWTLAEMYRRLSDSVLSGIPLTMSFTNGSSVIQCVYQSPE